MLDTLERFNDTLALVLTSVVAILWFLHGEGWINLPGEVIGASIMIMTLVTQFYFRKKPEENED